MTSESSDDSLNLEQQLNESLRDRYLNDQGEEIQDDIDEEDSVSSLSEQESEFDEQVVPAGKETGKVTVYYEYPANPDLGSIDAPVLEELLENGEEEPFADPDVGSNDAPVLQESLENGEEEPFVAEKHGICKWLSDVAWRKEYRELEEKFDNSKRLLKLFARDNMELCAQNRNLMSHGVAKRGNQLDVLCAKRRRRLFGVDSFVEPSSDGAESDPGISESASVKNRKRRIWPRMIDLID